MEQFALTAQPRQDLGKGASRRLRRQGLIPAILYGAGKEPRPLTLNHNELLKNLQHEAFYSHVLTLTLDNQPEKVVLKNLQRHLYRPAVLHADFLRISETEKLVMHIPLHFLNDEKCVGVKQGGGIISRHVIEVAVRCFPKDLPEFIEVDLTDVKLNQIIHLSDLTLPPGVELADWSPEHNLPVVSVHLPRTAHVEETAAAVPAEGQAEPQAAASQPPAKKEKDKG